MTVKGSGVVERHVSGLNEESEAEEWQTVSMTLLDKVLDLVQEDVDSRPPVVIALGV